MTIALLASCRGSLHSLALKVSSHLPSVVVPRMGGLRAKTKTVNEFKQKTEQPYLTSPHVARDRVAVFKQRVPGQSRDPGPNASAKLTPPGVRRQYE